MKKENESVIQEKFKTLIGGQALIEGIMMQGPDKRSIVVRGPEGIVTKVEPLKKRTGIAKWPLIRGVVNFASSMVSGVKALMYSAEFFPEEEDAKPSKFDEWLEKKLGSEKMEKAVISFSVVLGVLFSVGLFFLLPTLISGLFDDKTPPALRHELPVRRRHDLHFAFRAGQRGAADEQYARPAGRPAGTSAVRGGHQL